VAQKPKPDKRTSLLEQQKAIAAKLKAIDLSEKKTARKNDARVKIITGSIVRTDIEKNPQSPLATRVRELLNQFVEPRDRHLFPFLPPVEVAKEKPAAQIEVTAKANDAPKASFIPQQASG
jgi:hypothetical protein